MLKQSACSDLPVGSMGHIEAIFGNLRWHIQSHFSGGRHFLGLRKDLCVELRRQRVIDNSQWHQKIKRQLRQCLAP